MSLIDIPVSDLLAVAPFVADREVRYYLNGIAVEPDEEGGAILIATNGHILAAIRSPHARASSIAIIDWPKNLAAAARANIKGRPNLRLIVEEPGGYAKLADTRDAHVQVGKALIEGKYPEWRKIIPKELTAGLPGAYNRGYLDKVMSVEYSRSMERHQGVSFFYDAKCKEPKEAIVVARFPSLREMIVVLMPMRDPVEPLPGWLTRKPPAAAAPVEPVEEKAA